MITTRRALLALGVALGLALPAQAQEPRSYILTTATTGGTYYPVGVALATMVKVKLEPKQKIGMSAISSAGSAENIRLLRENEAQFGIVQGLWGYYGGAGAGPLEGQKQENLRAVSMLWQNVDHFIVNNDFIDTGTVADMVAMTGKRLAMGKQTSGAIGSNRLIFGNLGLDIDTDVELVYAGYGPSAEAVQNGQADGMSAPAGVPLGAVTQLFAAAGDSVTLLNVTQEQLDMVNKTVPLWGLYPIPAGSYPGQTEDVTSIAHPNILIVNKDVPEEDVYQITKAMFENLPFLRAIHKAVNELTVEGAMTGLPMPLHPGAARYYREAGLEIPARIAPQD